MRGTFKNSSFPYVTGVELAWYVNLLDRCKAVTKYALGLSPAVLKTVTPSDIGDNINTSRLYPRGDDSPWAPGLELGHDVLLMGWQGDDLYDWVTGKEVTPRADGLDPRRIEAEAEALHEVMLLFPHAVLMVNACTKRAAHINEDFHTKAIALRLLSLIHI